MRALLGHVPTTGAAAWHRIARLLFQRRPAPARLAHAAQLRALVAALDEAVAAQRDADLAVAACGEPGPVPGRVAQDCGHQSMVIHRLRERLRNLPLTCPELVEARTTAGRLLAYDQWMVRQALDLAFTAHADARTEEARGRLNGLGRPADDLRRLRDALHDRLRAQSEVGASES